MDGRKKSQETQNNGCFCVSLRLIRFRIRSPGCGLLSSAAGAGVEVCGGGAGDPSFLAPGSEGTKLAAFTHRLKATMLIINA